MFHDDEQTQLTNNWKRNPDEHPIDRLFTAYFNPTNQIRNVQSSYRSNNYKSETKHIIQRQRVLRHFLTKQDDVEPSIRKAPLLGTKPHELSITSIPSPHILFAELNEQSSNNNNRQQTIRKELERQSPIIIRRHRPTIENLSSAQQVSDITNISGNQLLLTIPSHFTFRNKPSRHGFLSDRSSLKITDRISSPRIKPLNYSKTISEGTIKHNTYNSKSKSLPTHIWTPSLSDRNEIHTRRLTSIVRSKAHLSRHFNTRHQHQQQLQSERMNINSKPNCVQDLYISTRSRNNNPHNELEINKKIRKKQIIIDEWEDLKSSIDGFSDEEESVSADGSSTSTSVSQISVQQYGRTSSSPSLSDQYHFSSFSTDNKAKIQRSPGKRSVSRRRAYNLALPPVAEHVDDEETDMKKILEKIYALHNNASDKKETPLAINDEDSLTFQLLNQQETEFEKKLSKLRKYESKQK